MVQYVCRIDTHARSPDAIPDCRLGLLRAQVSMCLRDWALAGPLRDCAPMMGPTMSTTVSNATGHLGKRLISCGPLPRPAAWDDPPRALRLRLRHACTTQKLGNFRSPNNRKLVFFRVFCVSVHVASLSIFCCWGFQVLSLPLHCPWRRQQSPPPRLPRPDRPVTCQFTCTHLHR